MRRTWALLVVLFAAPAPAVELRRVAELQVESALRREWLDPHRYMLLDNAFDRTERGAIRGVTFVVADVLERKVLRLPLDLDAFHRAHGARFTGFPNAELVYFDGKLGLLRYARREESRTRSYYTVWQVETQRLSTPKLLSELEYRPDGEARRVSYLFARDPTASRLYFADVTYDEKKRPLKGPTSLRLSRLRFPELEPDGWQMTVPLPKRERQLHLDAPPVFSSDGKKLALTEYDDSLLQKGSIVVPPAQVYVLDLEAKTVASYPIPRTPYGVSFSRDGEHLAIGSNEERVIIRIDLQAGRIDRRVTTQSHLHKLLTTPSGASLLVLSSQPGAPRPVELRRWRDLERVGTISLARIAPDAAVDPSQFTTTHDGKTLVATLGRRKQDPESPRTRIALFAVEEGDAPVATDPTALVLPFIEAARMRLDEYQRGRIGNTSGEFAPIASNENGEAFVIGSTSDLPEDAPFEEGKSHPYAVWVDANGKLIWKKSLRVGKEFTEYEAGSAVAAPDGTFIVFFKVFKRAGSNAAARVMKLDRKGRTLWQWTSPLGRAARIAHRLQLLPTGRIVMTGHVNAGERPWTGELDARTGKLVRDEVGAKARQAP